MVTDLKDLVTGKKFVFDSDSEMTNALEVGLYFDVRKVKIRIRKGFRREKVVYKILNSYHQYEGGFYIGVVEEVSGKIYFVNERKKVVEVEEA